jgi:hypothetical protein
MATVTWLGGVSQKSKDPANWSNGKLPSYDDDIILTSDAKCDLELTHDVECKTLTHGKNFCYNVIANGMYTFDVTDNVYC